MEHEQPSIILENENICRVGLRAPYAITIGCRDSFQAGNPGGGSLYFDGNFRHIDPHNRVGVPEHLLTTSLNIITTSNPRQSSIDTYGAGIRGSYFIH